MVKAILVAIIAGGVLIASFYLAYLLIFVVVLGGIGLIAFLCFSDNDSGEREFYD